MLQNEESDSGDTRKTFWDCGEYLDFTNLYQPWHIL